MNDYLIWLTEKLEKNLNLPFEMAMEMAITSSIVDKVPGYTVWDYLEERDTPTITPWPSIEDIIEAEG